MRFDDESSAGLTTTPNFILGTQPNFTFSHRTGLIA